jgi:hypothetical protein
MKVLTITGELEMADGSVVDAGGDVTVLLLGTLDMDGTSRLKMEGDLSFVEHWKLAMIPGLTWMEMHSKQFPALLLLALL